MAKSDSELKRFEENWGLIVLGASLAILAQMTYDSAKIVLANYFSPLEASGFAGGLMFFTVITVYLIVLRSVRRVRSKPDPHA
jgi:hypothetical protein